MDETTQVHELKGIDYSDKDTEVLVRQLCKQLNHLHKECHTEVVDFDLLAVFLMQEFGTQEHIRSIFKMVLTQFEPNHKAKPAEEPRSAKKSKQPPCGAPPQTTPQNQLLNAAKQVQKKIQQYDQGLSDQQPFCLQYPTYSKVFKNLISMQDKCKILPTDKMVVLLDEAGLCVGVGVPPFPKNPGKLPLQPDV
ncbi:hypothetical protein PGT21_018421 [Puccinia graminis f. sp. tritici]|uniref:Uncharacterized protein n=1 Tax=Puccinia graminis f. sp. tritici TaxID=56615 RepID=A0A5B0PYD1_PUCGR|nr:hypothetical protein PGT21_018421 [Puccinia graminis f. sp. tritici]